MLLRDQRNGASYLHVTFASARQNTQGHTTLPLCAITARARVMFSSTQERKLQGHVNAVNT